MVLEDKKVVRRRIAYAASEKVVMNGFNNSDAFVLGVEWADKHPIKKEGIRNLLKALFRELIHD